MVYFNRCASRGGSGSLNPQSATAEVDSPIEVGFLYGRVGKVVLTNGSCATLGV